jgi:hypothetical protein
MVLATELATKIIEGPVVGGKKSGRCEPSANKLRPIVKVAWSVAGANHKGNGRHNIP